MLVNSITLLCDRIIKMSGCTNNVMDNMSSLDDSEAKELYELDDSELESTFVYFNRDFTYPDANYDVRFMRIAREFSYWSKDPNMKVGCVAVRDRQIISQGYNGFPRGIKDDWRLFVKRIKLKLTVHAELNMVVNALDNGVSLKGATVYIYGLPVCSDCIKPLIQAKVERIVFCDITNGSSKSWSVDSETFKISKKMMDEKGITYRMIKADNLGFV